MTNEDALRCAQSLFLSIGEGLGDEAAAHIRHLVAENEALRLDAGTLRLCLTCGKTKPSDEPQHEPLKTCEADPDMGHLCSFDATPQESWQHWSRVAHERAAEIARLVTESEAQAALLRQAVEHMDAFNFWEHAELVAAIRQHLEGRA